MVWGLGSIAQWDNQKSVSHRSLIRRQVIIFFSCVYQELNKR